MRVLRRLEEARAAPPAFQRALCADASPARRHARPRTHLRQVAAVADPLGEPWCRGYDAHTKYKRSLGPPGRRRRGSWLVLPGTAAARLPFSHSLPTTPQASPARTPRGKVGAIFDQATQCAPSPWRASAPRRCGRPRARTARTAWWAAHACACAWQRMHAPTRPNIPFDATPDLWPTYARRHMLGGSPNRPHDRVHERMPRRLGTAGHTLHAPPDEPPPSSKPFSRLPPAFYHPSP